MRWKIAVSCKIVLEVEKNINECLAEYGKVRLEDVHALSAIAYGAAFGGIKGLIQLGVLGLLKKIGAVGPSKEDLMFGKFSANTLRYSEALKVWQQQTAYLLGLTLPPN